MAGAPERSLGSWVMKAPVPAALAEVSVTYVAGKVHVIGGNVLFYTGPYNEVYDPATDKWQAGAPMPRALDHVGTAVLNEKIYAFGGFAGSGKAHYDGQDTAFEYDPAFDTWRILAPMKGGRASVCAVALDGRLHVLGGRDATGTTLGRHEVYDPATNKWVDLAPFPKPRDHFAAAVLDGKIHIAGGRTGSPNDRTGQHDIYNPLTNAWTSAPPMITPRSGLASTVYKGLWLIIGGEMPSGTNSENEAYDPRTDSWRTLAPMPSGRHATGAATDGDHVYVAAGSLTGGDSGATNQLIVFTL
jgi:N-acetylneuraminic acid mutarotase